MVTWETRQKSASVNGQLVEKSSVSAHNSIFLGCTLHAKRIKTIEYAARAPVIGPEIDFSSLVEISVIAASGRPQFATC